MSKSPEIKDMTKKERDLILQLIDHKARKNGYETLEDSVVRVVLTAKSPEIID